MKNTFRLLFVLLLFGSIYAVFKWHFYLKPSPYLQPIAEAVFKLDSKKIKNTISDHFLSVTLDLSQIVGHKWWNESGDFEFMMGQGQQPPFDFTRPALAEYAKALSPFYLRVGGSMADQLDYFEDDQHVQADLKRPRHILTEAQFQSLIDFSAVTDSKILFNISADPRKWDSQNTLNTKSYEKILQAIKDNEDRFVGIEFGNEISVHGLMLGLKNLKSPKDYGSNFIALKNYASAFKGAGSLQGRSPLKWAGPANPSWPWIGEWFGFILNSTRNFAKAAGPNLDILTWHYYPTQSSRCGIYVRKSDYTGLLDPKALNEVSKWADQVRAARDVFAPKAELWMSETAHAQCGGERHVSDSYAGTLWWMDHLGQLANSGHQVVMRQVLSGADYGLLRDRDLKPRGDYWASVIWKKLVGTKVLTIEQPQNWPWLRHYAFCGKNRGEVIVLLLNISQKDPVTINADSLFETADKTPAAGTQNANIEYYNLSPDRLESDLIFLKDLNSPLHDKKMIQRLSDVNATRLVKRTFQLDPLNIVFLRLSYPNFNLCR